MDPTVFTALALAFGFTFGTAVITSIILQTGAIRIREQELEFKREMLLRHVPTGDVARALAAPSTLCPEAPDFDKDAATRQASLTNVHDKHHEFLPASVTPESPMFSRRIFFVPPA